MICDVCRSAERAERLVRYNVPGERLAVVENVPALVCPNCGETSFQPEVVDALLRTIWDEKAPARVAEASVYEFAR